MLKFILLSLLLSSSAFAQPVSETGLPLPRFVSLKSDEANMRNGPGKRYPVKWSYQRKGLPIKIINEYEHWRKVADHEGVVGWMHKSVLSGKRTGMVMADNIVLRRKPLESAQASAKLMKGVIVSIESCRPEWCEVEVKGGRADGWIPSSLLWGTKLD